MKKHTLKEKKNTKEIKNHKKNIQRKTTYILKHKKKHRKSMHVGMSLKDDGKPDSPGSDAKACVASSSPPSRHDGEQPPHTPRYHTAVMFEWFQGGLQLCLMMLRCASLSYSHNCCRKFQI